jgi:hypothetical protein
MSNSISHPELFTHVADLHDRWTITDGLCRSVQSVGFYYHHKTRDNSSYSYQQHQLLWSIIDLNGASIMIDHIITMRGDVITKTTRIQFGNDIIIIYDGDFDSERFHYLRPLNNDKENFICYRNMSGNIVKYHSFTLRCGSIRELANTEYIVKPDNLYDEQLFDENIKKIHIDINFCELVNFDKKIFDICGHHFYHLDLFDRARNIVPYPRTCVDIIKLSDMINQPLQHMCGITFVDVPIEII